MGFTYVNSCDDSPENTSLGFAKYEEATKTVPSVARSRAFRHRHQLLSGWLFPSGNGGYLQLRSSYLHDNKGIVMINGVSYDIPWNTEKPLAREATPGLCPPRQSLTLSPPRLMCTVDCPLRL